MKQSLILALSILLVASCTETKNYELAYRISEQDLIPEGITYSEKNKCFYISSILKTKIIQIDSKTGKFGDFIPSTLYNRRFVGMMIDNKRHHLWACGNFRLDSTILSSVFKFNTETRELIKEYHFPDTSTQMANDVVIDNDGNAYFTDSNNQHIYKVNIKTDSIELFFESEEIKHPNGISISPDNRYLYIASFITGVRVLDMETKNILNGVNEFASRGLDGMKFYNNSVIGIQNYFEDLHEIKIIRFHFDETLTKITGSEVIDQDNPYFDIPTTHVIIGDELYCLATSSLNNVIWEKYEIEDPSKLNDVKILKYKLLN